ncbi:MAG: hypothetical protein AABY27_02710, partial [Pseudomonadota bacterium]
HFDGNSFSIMNLFINRPSENNVGLFGIIARQKYSPAMISNIKIINATINGSYYVGALAGDAEYVKISNIEIQSSKIFGKDIVGGLLGTAKDIALMEINLLNNSISANKYKGVLAGSGESIQIELIDNSRENCIANIGLIGYSQDTKCLGVDYGV